MRFTKLFAAALVSVGLCAAGVSAKDMNVGFVYVTPIGDGGWSYAHNQGRLEIEKMFHKLFGFNFIKVLNRSCFL